MHSTRSIKTFIPWCGLLILVMAASGFSQTFDQATIGDAIKKIINVVTTYVVPGIGVLIIIKGAVDMMSGRPDALKTIIMAVIGVVVALGAGSIINYLTGSTVYK